MQSLQKQRTSLQKQLANIASKLDSGMIPGPEDLELPAVDEEGAPSTSSGTPPSLSGHLTPTGSISRKNVDME